MSACSVGPWLDALRFGVLSKFSLAKRETHSTHTHRPEPSKLTVVGRGWLYFPQTVPELAFHFSLLVGAVAAPTMFGSLAARGPVRGLPPRLLTNGFAASDWDPGRPRLVWQEALFWALTRWASLSRYSAVSVSTVWGWDAEVGGGESSRPRGKRKKNGGTITKQ